MTERDRTWLENAWRDHAGSVRAYLQRRAAPADIDDLLSEVFVVAWRHRDRKPRMMLPWLYGIGRRVLSTHHRSRERAEKLDHRLLLEPTQLGDGFQRSVQRSEIGTALEALSADDRELLMLVAWEGLEPREIAGAEGVTSAAVRMRLSRARKRFAVALQAARQREGARNE